MIIRFIDMFSGIGGFRLGLEKSNRQQQENPEIGRCGNSIKPQIPKSNQSEKRGNYFACVWANDNDKYACQIYRKQFGTGELHEGDIRTVDSDAIPEHDLLCAGFPCQSFSIAGKRKGFQDTRGSLFFEICRVIRAKRPSYLLLENVKGLLSSDDGATFLTILQSLDGLGYDCQWQVLNSKDYRVPQNRERVFIIGHLRGKPRPKVFPIGETDQAYLESTDRETDIFNIQKSGRGDKIETRLRQGFGTVGTAKGGDSKQEQTLVVQIAHTHKDRWGKWIKEQDIADTLDGWGTQGIATCLDSNYGKGWLDHGQRTMIANAVDVDGYLRFGERPRDENGKPQLLPIGYRRIRRLNPLECERLQGFPDNWTEGISDTQRYKCLGNAVTVNVIEAIGRQMVMELKI